MSPASLLLRAYYERLHERMVSRREALVARLDAVLAAELTGERLGPVDEDRRTAYREAALAFVEERLESYNPIGIQYTFDRVNAHEVAELEFQLNWYNSRDEFDRLVEEARALAGQDVADEELTGLADELIRRVGAFPDQSILVGYAAAPGLQKLPDYAVACAIEEIVCGREPFS